MEFYIIFAVLLAAFLFLAWTQRAARFSPGLP